MENTILLIFGGFFLLALIASMRPRVRPPQIVYVPIDHSADSGGGGWLLLIMIGVALAVILGSI